MSGQRCSCRSVKGLGLSKDFVGVVRTLRSVRSESRRAGPVNRLRNLRAGIWLKMFRVSYSDDRGLELFTSDQCIRDFVEQGPPSLSSVSPSEGGDLAQFGRVS